ncbi:hypothetical protein AB0H83_34930 [Dactylosporangium sp. NPDC050688]|uniref:hypothetical protein n=1 Tax=Dactylosporangium sp. NPDC050688 TaxID=3157217 RepID=UPI0033CEE3F6
MRLEVVIAALGSTGTAPSHQSGVYVWADGRAADADVLYIGEAADLKQRLTREESWTRNFMTRRHEGEHLWNSAGCGLEAVLARYPTRQPHTWPLSHHHRKQVQTALIRLAALAGATPPGQGAGWDYGKGKTLHDAEVTELLTRWFADEDFVGLTERAVATAPAADNTGRS